MGIVQSNGIHFPWDLTTSGISHADIAAAGGPAAQWDALPTASKLQIFGAIGFLEGWGENSKAMIGIMAFMAEAKLPGAVPGLVGKVTPYTGEIMAPFAAGDASLPYVSEMLKYTLPNV